MVDLPTKRQAVRVMTSEFGLSERRACIVVNIRRSTCRYEQKEDARPDLRPKLKELAAKRPRFGYRRLHVLLAREGFVVNHKCVYRLYRAEGLAVRRKKRKRLASLPRVPLPVVVAPNQQWNMDFVQDSMADGRKFRALNIIDACTRECPAIEVDTSLPGKRVVRTLERLADERGLPKVIVVDNGPEFICKDVDQWAHERGVTLEFIRPGKPIENAFIESFNGKFRDECLDQNWFLSLDQAKSIIEDWRQDYNEVRPHSALNNLTPAEFVCRWEAAKGDQRQPETVSCNQPEFQK